MLTSVRPFLCVCGDQPVAVALRSKGATRHTERSTEVQSAWHCSGKSRRATAWGPPFLARPALSRSVFRGEFCTLCGKNIGLYLSFLVIALVLLSG